MKTKQPKCYSYIRFSTPEQIKGDSLIRQLRMSEEYAKEKGFVIDKTLKMEDRGLSAYSGKHRTHGALGKFLEAIERGDVPIGSTLLVESLDRLSREKISDALSLFMDIINNGIIIVTLTDRREYSKETIDANASNLIMSLTIMARAYEESLQKSLRVAAAWESKRKNIGNVKLTGKCPAWLQLNHNKTAFKILKERTEIIEKIFNLSLQGLGIQTIAKKLNAANIPSWGKDTGWHGSYIQKIIKNRAVLGEFQPHKIVNKTRVPFGDPVSNYFPSVISEHIFYQVQERLKNNVSKGGKTGKIRSLFGGLAKCGYCNAPMQFLDKGKPPKGGRYLVCDNAIRGRGCHSTSFEYTSLEKAFLKYCSGLDFRELLSADQETAKSQQKQITDELAATEGKMRSNETILENLYSSLGRTNEALVQDHTMARISKVLKEQETLTSKHKELNQKLNSILCNQKTSTSKIEDLKELIHFMDSAQDDKLIELRLKLRGEIRQLIDKIEVFPLGNILSEGAYKNASYLLSSNKQLIALETEVINSLDSMKQGKRENRKFIIWFKNGNFRNIVADLEDPSKFLLLIERHGKEYYYTLIDR